MGAHNSWWSCLVEQLDAANLLGDLLGEDVVGLALDLFDVRHDCGMSVWRVGRSGRDLLSLKVVG